jgi:hypothetical protein
MPDVASFETPPEGGAQVVDLDLGLLEPLLIVGTPGGVE